MEQEQITPEQIDMVHKVDEVLDKNGDKGHDVRVSKDKNGNYKVYDIKVTRV